ncbi:hypothetical protein LTR65_010515 [Meristemomyces frigidus]
MDTLINILNNAWIVAGLCWSIIIPCTAFLLGCIIQFIVDEIAFAVLELALLDHFPKIFATACTLHYTPQNDVRPTSKIGRFKDALRLLFLGCTLWWCLIAKDAPDFPVWWIVMVTVCVHSGVKLVVVAVLLQHRVLFWAYKRIFGAVVKWTDWDACREIEALRSAAATPAARAMPARGAPRLHLPTTREEVEAQDAMTGTVNLGATPVEENWHCYCARSGTTGTTSRSGSTTERQQHARIQSATARLLALVLIAHFWLRILWSILSHIFRPVLNFYGGPCISLLTPFLGHFLHSAIAQAILYNAANIPPY